VKIRGHVLEVKSLGDKLEIKMQGSGDADAMWRSLNLITFQCADLPAARRSFHIGREVTVEIKAT